MSTDDSLIESPLNREEKALARQHWVNLMFATSMNELEVARQSLSHAAPRIQSCIMSAFIEWTTEAKDLTPDQTPFDE